MNRSNKASASKGDRYVPHIHSAHYVRACSSGPARLVGCHAGIPHGGFVIRSGKTGWNSENQHIIEYSLKLDSNPEFTSSVLVAYARAAFRMNQEGQKGCKTVFDVAPAYLCRQSGEELRAHML